MVKGCELTGDTVRFDNCAWGDARNASIMSVEIPYFESSSIQSIFSVSQLSGQFSALEYTVLNSILGGEVGQPHSYMACVVHLPNFLLNVKQARSRSNSIPDQVVSS